jgi:hypothetical protein
VHLDFYQIRKGARKLSPVAEEFTAFLKNYIVGWAGKSGLASVRRISQFRRVLRHTNRGSSSILSFARSGSARIPDSINQVRELSAIRKLSGVALVRTLRIRLGHESLDVTLAYLKGKDAEAEEAQEHANSSSLALYA